VLEQIAQFGEFLQGADVPDPAVGARWVAEAEHHLTACRAGQAQPAPLSELVAKYRKP